MILINGGQTAMDCLFLLSLGILSCYVSLAILDKCVYYSSCVKRRYSIFLSGISFGTGAWLVTAHGLIAGGRPEWTSMSAASGFGSLAAAWFVAIVMILVLLRWHGSHIHRVFGSLLIAIYLNAIPPAILWMIGGDLSAIHVIAPDRWTGPAAGHLVIMALSLAGISCYRQSHRLIGAGGTRWKLGGSFLFGLSFVTVPLIWNAAVLPIAQDGRLAVRSDVPEWLLAAQVLIFAFVMIVLLDRRRTIQDALQFKSAYLSHPDGICTLDAHGNLTMANPETAQLLGIPEAQLLGKPFLLFVHSDDRDSVQAFLERLATGGAEKQEFVVIRKGGERIDIVCSGVPILTNGAIAATCLFLKDNRERKLLYDKLTEHDSYLRGLFDNPATAIFLMDEKGRIITANQALQRMTGYGLQQLETMYFTDFLLPQNLNEVIGILHQKSDIPVTTEMVLVNKHGIETSVALSCNPVYASGKHRGIYCLVRDITYRKHIEKTLLNSRETAMEPKESEPADPGRKLRILMAREDINTTELAAKTGLSLATISNLRTGKIVKPQLLTAQLIADALNVETHRIWSDFEDAAADANRS